MGKQYISPKYEASETKHRNPEFNKLDIDDQYRIPHFSIKYGESREKFYKKYLSRIPGLAKNPGLDYDITKSGNKILKFKECNYR